MTSSFLKNEKNIFLITNHVSMVQNRKRPVIIRVLLMKACFRGVKSMKFMVKKGLKTVNTKIDGASSFFKIFRFCSSYGSFLIQEQPKPDEHDDLINVLNFETP